MAENTEKQVANIQVKKKKSLGRQCAAFGCYNFSYNTDGSPSGLHFFKFPQKNPEKRVWCNLIKRVDGLDGFKVTASTVLCQEHFKDEDLKRNPQRWKLHHGAVPSLKLYNSDARTSKMSRKAPKDRSHYYEFPQPQPSSSATSEVNDCSDSIQEDVSNYRNSSTQTSFSFVVAPVYFDDDSSDDENKSSNEQREYVNLQKKIDELYFQISNLNAELSVAKKAFFSLEKLQNDDSAVKFYTGFPNYSSLRSVYEYLEPKLQNISYWRGSKSHGTSKERQEWQESSTKPGPKRKLSHFEEFIFVLMRLKVGLFLNDLADRFGISVGHASKIFSTWINFLYHELPLLFPFPPKEHIEALMPDEFKKYPSTRIVIDCTEIFTEVPSSMKAQSQTWSEYKHHNTWKALIGISPTGAITFVSKLWSGRVSDKEITRKSGLIDLLEPGDNVMADRGFDIADILPVGVTLNIPPFKGSRSQLTPAESEETAQIAAVRIHVERAIGRIKNYHILNGVLPLSLCPLTNQIFTVCSLLTNFLPFLVIPSIHKK